ncbi:MAG TPA: MBL fold metallo-hydrolase [Ktedonobacteraceae bacterium]|nr:MBL fold metallo-hydrolase [Ktedonobacteraceae bacterium]
MSNATPRMFSLGDATIAIINAGDMMVDMAEELNAPESEWRPLYGSVFEGSRPFPSQSVHIALPGASILVDANDYPLAIALEPSFLPPDYTPPPGIIEQLATIGVRPADITHLVITHAHFDHYIGTTIEHDGKYLPRFPNAHVYLGRADWEDPQTQEELRNPASIDSRTFGVLNRLGMLELVEGNRDLLPGVRIIAAPGESPGHQIVRVHLHGQTLYCLGDLFHHPSEVEHPAWMVKWANASANLASRRALIEAALQEDAILIAAHMPPGRLEGTLSNPRWTPLMETNNSMQPPS